MENEQGLNDKACVDLLQAVILDAVRISQGYYGRSTAATTELAKVVEFGKRKQNQLIEYYCDFFQVDETKLRNILIN